MMTLCKCFCPQLSSCYSSKASICNYKFCTRNVLMFVLTVWSVAWHGSQHPMSSKMASSSLAQSFVYNNNVWLNTCLKRLQVWLLEPKQSCFSVNTSIKKAPEPHVNQSQQDDCLSCQRSLTPSTPRAQGHPSVLRISMCHADQYTGWL